MTYQGSAGRNLLQTSDLNAAIYGPGANRTNTNQRRPRPEFTQLTLSGTYGWSDYHAMVISMERRFSSGLSFLADIAGKRAPTSFRARRSKGMGLPPPRTAGSTRTTDCQTQRCGPVHRLVQLRAAVCGGEDRCATCWADGQTNGIVSLQTGGPFTISSGLDNAFSGINADRADIIGNPTISEIAPKERRSRAGSINAFAINAPGTFGNLGRNTNGAGPGSPMWTSRCWRFSPCRTVRAMRWSSAQRHSTSSTTLT